MFEVHVKSATLKEITSQKNGRKYFFQNAALANGDDFPHPFEILHDDPKKAYPPGRYRFADDAIYVDRGGKLSVSARLVPIAAASAKAG